MKRTSVLVFAVILVFLGLESSILFAQESTLSSANGKWITNGNWTDNSFPGSAVGEDVTVSGVDITINGTIIVGVSNATPGTLTFSGNDDTHKIIINGTLIVFGKVHFDTDAMTLELSSTGKLIVFGDLELKNKVNLSSTGNVIVTGQLKKDGSQSSITGTGDFFAGSYNTGGNSAQDAIGNGPPDRSLNTGTDLSNKLPNVFNYINCINAGGTSTSCNSQLPVKISRFDTHVEDNTVVVEWTTTMEELFDRFVLERSTDGFSFQDVAEIKGRGRDIYNIETNYRYVDEYPVLGLNYYRLRAIDLDGSFEHFGIKAVRTQVNKSLAVFPNPASGNKMTITLNFEPAESDQILIFNQLGDELFNTKVKSFDTTIDFTSALPSGLYIIKFISEGFEKAIRVNVQ